VVFYSFCLSYFLSLPFFRLGGSLITHYVFFRSWAVFFFPLNGDLPVTPAGSLGKENSLLILLDFDPHPSFLPKVLFLNRLPIGLGGTPP